MSFLGGKGGPARKAHNLTASVSQLSRKCGSLNISQPYGPSRPVTGIALPLPVSLHVIMYPHYFLSIQVKG
jgi:hypothetical protein